MSMVAVRAKSSGIPERSLDDAATLQSCSRASRVEQHADRVSTTVACVLLVDERRIGRGGEWCGLQLGPNRVVMGGLAVLKEDR